MYQFMPFCCSFKTDFSLVWVNCGSLLLHFGSFWLILSPFQFISVIRLGAMSWSFFCVERFSGVRWWVILMELLTTSVSFYNFTFKFYSQKSGPSWAWSLDLQLLMQSVPITTNLVSLNTTQVRCFWYNIMW